MTSYKLATSEMYMYFALGWSGFQSTFSLVLIRKGEPLELQIAGSEADLSTHVQVGAIYVTTQIDGK